ncbi:hypothetical protein ACQKII_20480 [Lysinibacillus sp. NPDC048646]|uniref:hypothetical protein n=1 Tax=Lysinibacillus sp. NPDC048646 TaxID=3390574 RepID=UPI003D01EB81
MNNEKKGFNIDYFISKLSQLVVAAGGIAVVQSCTLIFHEKKVPSELLNDNQFTVE